jgi:hypothetical protein
MDRVMVQRTAEQNKQIEGLNNILKKAAKYLVKHNVDSNVSVFQNAENKNVYRYVKYTPLLQLAQVVKTKGVQGLIDEYPMYDQWFKDNPYYNSDNKDKEIALYLSNFYVAMFGGTRQTIQNDEQEGSPIQEGNYKKYPRIKRVCDYYSTPAGCKKGDRCDFLHPQVSLSVLELEKEQAHGMDGSHIGSNNDINAHDTILDSGSSNHSTGLRRMLDDIESRDPITMKTVIGMKKVSEIGTLELNDKVKLNNVRLIEGSPFTLMALAPLVDRGNKAVTFFKDTKYDERIHNRKEVITEQWKSLLKDIL